MNQPDRRVEVTCGHRHLVAGADLGVEGQTQAVADHADRLGEPRAQDVEHGAGRRLFQCLPEQHHVANDGLGLVVADVTELLGPHVADVPAQR